MCDGSNFSHTRHRGLEPIKGFVTLSTVLRLVAKQPPKRTKRRAMRVSVDREPQRVLALWSSYNQKPSDPSDKRHVSSPNEMGIRYPRFQLSSSGLPAAAIGTTELLAVMSNETASFVSYQLQPPKGRWRGSSKRVCLYRAPEVRVQ